MYLSGIRLYASEPSQPLVYNSRRSGRLFSLLITLSYSQIVPSVYSRCMGQDRTSRRVRVQRTPSLTPSPSAREKALAIDKRMSDASPPGNKSLTPHRKHHKLLKDGSEVWSEDVERIFVQGMSSPTVPQAVNFFYCVSTAAHRFFGSPLSPTSGLREYWESPWATYSRGRSRWRNQFLVEHLKKAGIDRSKKQVASHIQVLRNMWRGEPGKSPSFKPPQRWPAQHAFEV